MRQTIRPLVSVPYAAGQIDIPIPRVGYLSRLWIRFSGTLDNSGTAAGTAGWRSPWELLQSARLNVNGNLFPQSADGYGYELLARAMRPGYVDDSSMGVAVGDNTVEFTTQLPLAVTDANLTGVIWTGNSQTTTILETVWRAASDPDFATGPAANTLSLTGTIEVWGEIFMFGTGETKPDLSTMHNFTVLSQVLNSTGDQYINLPTLNQVYLRIFHVIENNGAALGYTQGMLDHIKIESYEDPYTISDGEFQSMQNYRYLGKLPLSTGARVIDLYWSRTLRDVINSTGLSLLQSIINVPGGTAVAAPAKIYTYIESMSPLS